MLCTLFFVFLCIMLIIMVLKCFINQYMKQHDLAPGIHAYHPYTDVCGIVLLLLGVLSYTYARETAAQCISPSFESTGLESKIGWSFNFCKYTFHHLISVFRRFYSSCLLYK